MSGLEPTKNPDPLTLEEINGPEFLTRLQETSGSGNSGPDAKRAFRELVFAMHERISGFIERLVPSQDLVQKMVRETYLAVHKGLPAFQGDRELSNWILSLALERIKAGDFKKAAVPAMLDGRNAMEKLIGKATESLSEDLHQAYRLHDVEGLSEAEAAEILGVPAEIFRERLQTSRIKVVEWVREKLAGASK